MANLIITIISIALVAVAAIMGAYYGGTAFMNGQVKARATTIITQGDQIIAGLRLWQVATANDPSLYPAWNGISGTSSTLVPAYLTQMPKQPVGYNNWLVTYVSASGFMGTVGNGGITSGGSMGPPARIVGVFTYFPNITDTSALQVCAETNRIMINSTNIPTMSDGLFSLIMTLPAIFGNNKGLCFIDDTNKYLVFAFRI